MIGVSYFVFYIYMIFLFFYQSCKLNYGWIDERKDGWKKGINELVKEGRMDLWKKGRKEGWIYEREEGRKEGWIYG